MEHYHSFPHRQQRSICSFRFCRQKRNSSRSLWLHRGNVACILYDEQKSERKIANESINCLIMHPPVTEQRSECSRNRGKAENCRKNSDEVIACWNIVEPKRLFEIRKRVRNDGIDDKHGKCTQYVLFRRLPEIRYKKIVERKKVRHSFNLIIELH